MSDQIGTQPVEIEVFADVTVAPDVIALMHRAFAQYTAAGETSGAMLETAETLRTEMTGGLHLAVLRVGGRVVASAKHRGADDGTLYFSRLAVDPSARGRGLAGQLVRAMHAKAREDGLLGLSCAVRANEQGNIAIYEHLGMEIIGHETRLSRTGAVLPVVVMRDAAVAG